MPETIREVTERVVTDDVPPNPAADLSPLSQGADAPASPDAATMEATTTAIAAGVEIGKAIGAAEVATAVATTTAQAAVTDAAEWQRRATAAEAEAVALRARVVELETPPETAATPEAATTTEVVVDDAPATAATPEPAPMKARGFWGKMFLG